MKLSHLIIAFFAMLAVYTVITTAAFPKPEAGSKCRILMSSGGGDRIYFELGALTAFRWFMEQQEIAYDVVTGISAGSLLSGLLSRYPVGDELRAVTAITRTLFKVQQRADIIRDWPGGWFEGLTQHSGIFDSTPLLERINEWMLTMPATDRALRVGAVDQSTGQMDIYHENSENLNLGILGSCSVPGIFPAVPVSFKDGRKRLYVDGGMKSNYIYESGFQACFDKGFQEHDIIVDALMCYTTDFNPKVVTDDIKTLDSLMRGMDISSFHNGVAKLESMMARYPKANFRHIMMPNSTIGPLPSVGLNFIPQEMTYMYERGRNDTQIELTNHPNGNWGPMMERFRKITKDNDIAP